MIKKNTYHIPQMVHQGSSRYTFHHDDIESRIAQCAMEACSSRRQPHPPPSRHYQMCTQQAYRGQANQAGYRRPTLRHAPAPTYPATMCVWSDSIGLHRPVKGNHTSETMREGITSVAPHPVYTNPIFSRMIRWCPPFHPDRFAKMESQRSLRTWHDRHIVLRLIIWCQVIGDTTYQWDFINSKR